MTDKRHDGTDIQGDDFEEALANLVMDAVLEGISVEGAWDVSRDDLSELPDFTVEIYEIDRSNRDND